MTILQIKSSLFSNGGQSSRLADEYVARQVAAELDADVIVRDLATDPAVAVAARWV